MLNGALQHPCHLRSPMVYDREGYCPLIYSRYIGMDELSISLNHCQIGCYAGNKLVNHIMYADDVALMSPSAAGLAKIIKNCELFGNSMM